MGAILRQGCATWSIWGGIAAVAPVIEGVGSHSLQSLALVYLGYVNSLSL